MAGYDGRELIRSRLLETGGMRYESPLQMNIAAGLFFGALGMARGVREGADRWVSEFGQL